MLSFLFAAAYTVAALAAGLLALFLLIVLTVAVFEIACHFLQWVGAR